MGGDEVMVMVWSTVAASYLWGAWYLSTSQQWSAGRALPGRAMLWTAPLIAAVLIVRVLTTVASHDVVNDIRYIHLYFALGLTWVGLAMRALPALGLHMRDDAIERRNLAVVPAIAGAILGVALAYAGGNIGDGPGWWVVVASALISTSGLFAVWYALELLTGVAESVTVERDVAAGWRLGGFLTAVGLVLGRSVAGDWMSLSATIGDAVRFGWPVLVLLVIATVIERASRVNVQSPRRPVAMYGQLPAFVLVGLAVGWVVRLGIPQ